MSCVTLTPAAVAERPPLALHPGPARQPSDGRRSGDGRREPLRSLDDETLADLATDAHGPLLPAVETDELPPPLERLVSEIAALADADGLTVLAAKHLRCLARAADILTYARLRRQHGRGWFLDFDRPDPCPRPESTAPTVAVTAGAAGREAQAAAAEVWIGWGTKKKFKGFLILQDPRCAYCGQLVRRKSATVDHVTPRSRGGGNEPHNLRLACKLCNEAKADRDPLEWAADVLAGGGMAGELPRLAAMIAERAAAAKGGAA